MPLPLPPLPIDGPTALAVVVVPVPLIFGAMAVGDASAGVDLPSSELPLSGPPPAAPSLDMIMVAPSLLRCCSSSIWRRYDTRRTKTGTPAHQ